MPLFYVSYCAPGGFLGAAFIEASDVVAATKRGEDEGFSPGGKQTQTLAFRYDGLDDVPAVPEPMRNRLLSADELLGLWPDAKDLMGWEDHVG